MTLPLLQQRTLLPLHYTTALPSPISHCERAVAVVISLLNTVALVEVCLSRCGWQLYRVHVFFGVNHSDT
jgi:hypothetical protein